MTNRLFQSVIHQMKDTIGRVVGVMDDNGLIVACSELQKIGEVHAHVREELAYSSDALVMDGYTYRFLFAGNKNDHILFVEGTDKNAEKYAAILAVALSNIKKLYDEKYDRASFIKNIILIL